MATRLTLSRLSAQLPTPTLSAASARLPRSSCSFSTSAAAWGRPTIPRAALAPFAKSPPFFSTSIRAYQKQRAIPSASSFFTTSRHVPPSRAIYFTHARKLSTVAPSPTFNAPPPVDPLLTTPDVSKYLAVIAGLVFSIVVVGGLTRLTESGLSITEWNLVTGTIPPLSAADWEREFDKYRLSPEWRLQNQHIEMREFKKIFLWEWSHRMLGRFIGLAFLAPIPYFLLRRRLSPRSAASLLGIGTLIGCQGAMGWYMVKSGLDEIKVQELGGVARVSQYRLAAHLGMAFLVYASCVRLALGIGRDHKIVNGANGKGAGIGGIKEVAKSLEMLNTRTAGRMRVIVNSLTALIFLTALSGAFVAGLDAGLVYNEFPYMGEHIHPPKSELMNPKLARKADGSDMWWRNMLENPVTAQWDHRVLAMTTFTSIVTLFLYARRPSVAMHLPPTTLRLIKGTMHMSVLQVALGISTLVYLVPIPLASAHQAGSLVLLTLALAAGASLRRPGKVAREIMKVRRSAVKA